MKFFLMKIKLAIWVGYSKGYLNKYDPKKEYVTRLKMNFLHKIVHSDSPPCCSITTPAVAGTIQIIAALLGIDIRRVATAVSLCHPLGLRGKLIRGRRSREVAPVGRNQSSVRIYDTKGRREGTNHAARSVWPTRIFVDPRDENVIRRGYLFKLQNDLLRPVAHVLGEDLIAPGALLVTLDRDAAIKLFPEFE
jgi:hypothetical protein